MLCLSAQVRPVLILAQCQSLRLIEALALLFVHTDTARNAANVFWVSAVRQYIGGQYWGYRQKDNHMALVEYRPGTR